MLGGVGFLAGRGCPGGPRGTGLVGWKGRQLALCPEWCPLGLYPTQGRRPHKARLCVPCPSPCSPLPSAGTGLCGKGEEGPEVGGQGSPSQMGPSAPGQPEVPPVFPSVPQPFQSFLQAAGRQERAAMGRARPQRPPRGRGSCPSTSSQVPALSARWGWGTGAPWWRLEARAGAEGFQARAGARDFRSLSNGLFISSAPPELAQPGVTWRHL